MTPDQSFGNWLRRQRRALDLTQEELARQVGCSAITLRKLEAEERRPSKQIAERLAEVLHVPPEGQADFLRFARGDPFAAPDSAKAAEQPALAPAPRHNLPHALTRFIGREREIGEITALLSAERLVTLTGTGGTGKTRLALAAAAGLLEAYAEGVWLVELAPLAEPALVPQALGAVLGLQEVPGRAWLDTLVRHLGEKSWLLILDNCEHVIEACAALAYGLLRACPQLTILATSREALRLGGERAYPVPALSLPPAGQDRPIETLEKSEAGRLFVERARAALPTFALTPANAPAVAEICRELDGLPLALELAAACVKIMPVEQIAARLDDRFRLLTRGSRAATRRHQTLQALLDWSYALLTPAEQTLLAQLAVFAGGWTLEAAEAVAGEDEGRRTAARDELIRLAQRSFVFRHIDVLGLLARLVDQSLVQVELLPTAGVALYHLLETIRQYALARLEGSGEADAVRRRHAAYFLKVWQRNEAEYNAHGTLGSAWLDLKDMELANLRAALNWSLSPGGDAALGVRLSANAPTALFGYSASHAWLESALAQAQAHPTIDTAARALALRSLGELDAQLANWDGAQASLSQSLALYQALGSQRDCATLLERLGWLARERGDAEVARRRLEESLVLLRELGDNDAASGMLTTLGDVAVMQGDSAEAARLLQAGLALHRKVGNWGGVAWSLNHLGHVARMQGQYETARQLYEDSGQLFFDPTDAASIGMAHADLGLAETALAQGRAALALRHFRQALQAFRFHNARLQITWCLAGLAGVFFLEEEPQRAARLWGASEALHQSIGGRDAPAAAATRQRLMAAAREQLGDAAFDAAWAQGETLTMDQAIAEAFADTQTLEEL